MSKTIKIQIYPDGHIQAEVKGFKGKKCAEYQKILEEILEATTVDSAYTPEYYESEQIQASDQEELKIKGKD